MELPHTTEPAQTGALPLAEPPWLVEQDPHLGAPPALVQALVAHWGAEVVLALLRDRNQLRAALIDEWQVWRGEYERR